MLTRDLSRNENVNTSTRFVNEIGGAVGPGDQTFYADRACCMKHRQHRATLRHVARARGQSTPLLRRLTFGSANRRLPLIFRHSRVEIYGPCEDHSPRIVRHSKWDFKKEVERFFLLTLLGRIQIFDPSVRRISCYPCLIFGE